MAVNNRQICKEIRAHAAAKKLSIRALFEAADINRSQWVRWLANKFEPKQTSVDRLFAVSAKPKKKNKKKGRG